MFESAQPILFSHSEVHSVIASELSGTVLSAGFWDFDKDGKFVCFGRSTTLKMDARPEEDSILLNTWFRMNQ
jgi:hypothetical protein